MFYRVSTWYSGLVKHSWSLRPLSRNWRIQLEIVVGFASRWKSRIFSIYPFLVWAYYSEFIIHDLVLHPCDSLSKQTFSHRACTIFFLKESNTLLRLPSFTCVVSLALSPSFVQPLKGCITTKIQSMTTPYPRHKPQTTLIFTIYSSNPPA